MNRSELIFRIHSQEIILYACNVGTHKGRIPKQAFRMQNHTHASWPQRHVDFDKGKCLENVYEYGQDSTDLADPMVRISIASVTALMYHGYLSPKSVTVKRV